MSNNVTEDLHEFISKQLMQREFDLVGIVPIPTQGDRMVRLRTLQEIIEEFEESSGQGTMEYLLQIKPKSQKTKSNSQQPKADTPSFSKTVPESIYLANGKLNIPFLMKNADLLSDAGEYHLAKNIYKTILKSGENTSAVLFRIGKCLESEGKLSDARAHYEESITYYPTLEVFQKLGALSVSEKQDQKAAEIFERALSLKDIQQSKKFELHKAAGNCWTRANKDAEAERHFKKALEIDPSADEIRSNLGALYLQNNKIPEAKRHFRDAIASNSRNHQALAGLGSCYLAENDKKSAHDYFAQSLEIELNNPAAIYHLVKCAYEIKIYAAAARILENYIQIAPVNTNLLYSLAGLQFHLGRIQEAQNTTLKILDLQPQHVGAKDLLSLIEKYAGSKV